MTFKRLLCTTDFSPGSTQAVRQASVIASRTNAELVLAHVCYLPAFAYASEAGPSPTLVQDMVDDAERDLDLAVREASAQLTRAVTGTLLNGVPWAEVVSLLETERFDLCVIGTHGRTGLARVVLGSVAEKVVRHAPCPVLVVRPGNDAKPFRHVLVPTDFSTSAAQALQLAATLVGPEGRVTLLHVLDLPAPYPGEAAEAELSGAQKRARAALDEAAAAVTGKLRVATAFRCGAPGEQILAALDNDASIDLVAVGSHGRTGIKRALIGSVAEKIVRYARCPVLVARQPATS